MTLSRRGFLGGIFRAAVVAGVAPQAKVVEKVLDRCAALAAPAAAPDPIDINGIFKTYYLPAIVDMLNSRRILSHFQTFGDETQGTSATIALKRGRHG